MVARPKSPFHVGVPQHGPGEVTNWQRGLGRSPYELETQDAVSVASLRDEGAGCKLVLLVYVRQGITCENAAFPRTLSSLQKLKTQDSRGRRCRGLFKQHTRTQLLIIKLTILLRYGVLIVNLLLAHISKPDIAPTWYILLCTGT
jgi:hypothetical protein